MIRTEILERLMPITAEEQKILAGNPEILKETYTDESAGHSTAAAASDPFIIDSRRLLEKGKLIDCRAHTRFAYFPQHSHNYVEMLYVLSGSITTRVNETDTLNLTVGDLLFLNQHASHEIFPCGECDIAVNFIILPEFFTRPVSMLERENVLRDFLVQTLSGQNASINHLLLHTQGLVPVENLLDNLLWNMLIKKHGMNTVNQATMGLLLMNLSVLSAEMHTESKDDRTLFVLMDYIDKNYKDGSLAEIADRAGYSSYHLSRMLKNATGHNFKELLQQRKLQQAIYYLENTTLPTDRILEEIGYENSSYFYRVFRERFGCSPKEYRNRHAWDC